MGIPHSIPSTIYACMNLCLYIFIILPHWSGLFLSVNSYKNCFSPNQGPLPLPAKELWFTDPTCERVGNTVCRPGPWIASEGPSLLRSHRPHPQSGALALEGRIGPGLEGSRINRTGSGKVTFNILWTALNKLHNCFVSFPQPQCYKQAEAKPARRAEHAEPGGSSQSSEEGEAAGSGPSHTPGLQLCYDVVARRENCLFSKEGVILS